VFFLIRKVIFLGPPEAGKTSLRKFLFENIPAQELLDQSQAPTIGLKNSIFAYTHILPATLTKKGKVNQEIPLNLNIVDSAGQQLEDWLIGPRKARVFGGADMVFFIFDVTDFLDETKKLIILDTIVKVFEARQEFAPESAFYIIGHKFDLVPEGIGFRDQLVKNIKKEVRAFVYESMSKYNDFEVYITSLTEEYANETYATLLTLTTDILCKIQEPEPLQNAAAHISTKASNASKVLKELSPSQKKAIANGEDPESPKKYTKDTKKKNMIIDRRKELAP